MPTIEMMLVDYGAKLGVRPERAFNLDAAVGVGAANKVGDVMLVQAMLQGLNKGGARHYFYNRKTLDQTRLPEPHGRMDHETLTAIRNLQMWLASRLLAVDGRIDPAAFAGRKLNLPLPSRRCSKYSTKNSVFTATLLEAQITRSG